MSFPGKFVPKHSNDRQLVNDPSVHDSKQHRSLTKQSLRLFGALLLKVKYDLGFALNFDSHLLFPQRSCARGIYLVDQADNVQAVGGPPGECVRVCLGVQRVSGFGQPLLKPRRIRQLDLHPINVLATDLATPTSRPPHGQSGRGCHRPSPSPEYRHTGRPGRRAPLTRPGRGVCVSPRRATDPGLL